MTKKIGTKKTKKVVAEEKGLEVIANILEENDVVLEETTPTVDERIANGEVVDVLELVEKKDKKKKKKSKNIVDEVIRVYKKKTGEDVYTFYFETIEYENLVVTEEIFLETRKLRKEGKIIDVEMSPENNPDYLEFVKTIVTDRVKEEE